MKKKLMIAILVLMLITMLIPTLFAAERPSIETAKLMQSAAQLNQGDTNSEDAEVTGILPTSPFYFLKELGRGVRRILTVNPIARAEYELSVVNEKAAELNKLRELDPQNAGAVRVAVENYHKDAKQLDSYLVVAGDNASDAEMGPLLKKAARETTTHQKVFEILKEDYGAIKDKIEAVQNDLGEALIRIPEQFKLGE